MKRFITVENIRLTITIGLALATIFGFVAPREATLLRNDVLVPLGLVPAGTADIL